MLVLAEQNRTFGYAVAASIALHALALAAQLPAKRQIVEAPPEPPLVAHLVELPPPAPPAVAKEEPAKPKPQPTRPKPIAKPAPPKPAPAPRPSTPIAAAPPTPAPPPVIEEPPMPEGVDHASPELAPLAPPPTVAAIAPPPVAPPDPAADLARFRQELVDMAVRYKRYPRMALDNGWTGDVVVRIDVAASGAVRSVQVKTSSGYSVLDEQALEMFRRAAPAVQVPPALHGKDFSVEVRAIYNLQDRPG